MDGVCLSSNLELQAVIRGSTVEGFAHLQKLCVGKSQTVNMQEMEEEEEGLGGCCPGNRERE